MARGIVIKPGDVFRDLGALSDVLDLRGGGGSPKEVRSDAGIFVQYDLAAILSRHADLVDQDVETLQIAIGGANATSSGVFSFSEDHYLQAVEWTSSANPANFLFGVLRLTPTIQTDSILIAFTQLADRITFIGLPGSDDYFEPHLPGVGLPLFVRAATDYVFTARSGAGGGTTVNINVFRSQAPQGVEIAH